MPDIGAEDESYRCLHVPSFVGGEHVLSSCECRDETQHLGNPKWARAGDLTGNSRGSGGGKNPHLFRRSGLVEKSFM